MNILGKARVVCLYFKYFLIDYSPHSSYDRMDRGEEKAMKTTTMVTLKLKSKAILLSGKYHTEENYWRDEINWRIALAKHAFKEKVVF